MTLTTATFIAWLRHGAELVHERRNMLTELDAAIGDADHGANLDRGFAMLVTWLDNSPAFDDTGILLQQVGQRLIATVGGASGPLYGTAFRRAGRVLEGEAEIDVAQLTAALRAVVEGIQAIGKAVPGDKTMLDALVPALGAFQQAVAHKLPLAEAIDTAASAAEAGAATTIPLVARRGRASYLGARSAGHQDPGATSAALLLRALADVVGGPAASR